MPGKYPEKTDNKRKRKGTQGRPCRKSKECGLLSPLPIDGWKQEVRSCCECQPRDGVKAQETHREGAKAVQHTRQSRGSPTRQPSATQQKKTQCGHGRIQDIQKLERGQISVVRRKQKDSVKQV